MNVVNGLLQDVGEVLACFNGKDLLQRQTPIFFRIRPSPAGKSAPQRPHGERQPGKPKSLVSQFEELSIAERRVILLLVNPMFDQEPFDEALSVALGHHPNRAQCRMQARNFTGPHHQGKGAEY